MVDILGRFCGLGPYNCFWTDKFCGVNSPSLGICQIVESYMSSKKESLASEQESEDPFIAEFAALIPLISCGINSLVSSCTALLRKYVLHSEHSKPLGGRLRRTGAVPCGRYASWTFQIYSLCLELLEGAQLLQRVQKEILLRRSLFFNWPERTHME